MKERFVNGAGEAMARHVRAEGEILSIAKSKGQFEEGTREQKVR